MEILVIYKFENVYKFFPVLDAKEAKELLELELKANNIVPIGLVKYDTRTNRVFEVLERYEGIKKDVEVIIAARNAIRWFQLNTTMPNRYWPL
ncbi:hypothetical protein [Spirosoma litoris]